jgi:hypothetical protein
MANEFVADVTENDEVPGTTVVTDGSSSISTEQPDAPHIHKFAYVIDGTVVSVINVTERTKAILNSDPEIIECTNVNPELGWTYSNGSFAAPTV